MECVYCLDTNVIEDRQVLARSDNFYVCAPRGQLVEGYLAIAPYRCIGCLAMLPRDCFAELVSIQRLIRDYYRDVYGVGQPVFYEQGRAGGGANAQDVGGFPLHAHLCCLPIAADVHGLLEPRYGKRKLSGLHDLPGEITHDPYVLVESGGHCSVYVPRN